MYLIACDDMRVFSSSIFLPILGEVKFREDFSKFWGVTIIAH